jgi:predicted enzyme related to lactoylglutathione lyase
MQWNPARVLLARCAVLVASGLVVPAQAALPDLPPLDQPPSGEHHPGKMIWADLVSPDLEVAKRFYSAMFGWTFEDLALSGSTQTSFTKKEYALARLDGVPVAGIVQRDAPAGDHAQAAWLTFLAVRNADEAGRIATARGARILAEPRTYGRRGRQVILADPQGAVFGILASSSGDRLDVLAEPGEWIWSSLLVQDPDKDAAFYQDLLACDVFDLPSDDGREHAILASDNYARASVNAMPDDSVHRYPHWLNFIRVQNAADSAAKAASLGGRVLVEAHTDRHGGQVAVVADPQGAPLGLMEWTEISEQGSAK